MSRNQLRPETGTIQHPTFYPGQKFNKDGILMTQRFFTYAHPRGLVSGIHMNMTFPIDKSPSEVWPYFSDLNTWMNAHGYFYQEPIRDLYSDPVGELGDERFKITIDYPDDEDEAYEFPDEYRVLRVFAERGIVFYQPAPAEDPGSGVSPGFTIFLLNEAGDGTSLVSFFNEHTQLLEDENDEDPVKFWRDLAPEYERFWTQTFVSELRRVSGASQ